MKRNFTYWLRWIVVLPGSILTGVLSTFLLHFVLYQSTKSWIEPYPEAPERLLMPGVVMTVIIWSSSKIAPEHKFKAAIGMFALMIFIMGGIVFLTASETPYFGMKMKFEMGGVSTIIAAIGAFLGLWLAYRNNNNSLEPFVAP